MYKKIYIITVFFIASCSPGKEKIVAEVSCGQCQLGLTDKKGCDLAIRIDGKAYFVDGAHIDDFGDAHDKETGFCEVIRKAEVFGKIEGNRYQADTIRLID